METWKYVTNFIKTMKNRQIDGEFKAYSLPFPHFGTVHFRCASAYCSDCSPHEHDVLKPCEPITTAIGVGPIHGNRIDQIDAKRMEKERGHWVSTSHRGVLQRVSSRYVCMLLSSKLTCFHLFNLQDLRLKD